MTFFVAELEALFFVFGKERERKEREPVTGEMRRNAGQDRAGTQGWRRPRQVAMPAKTVPGRKAAFGRRRGRLRREVMRREIAGGSDAN